jgi:hypothetical protein
MSDTRLRRGPETAGLTYTEEIRNIGGRDVPVTVIRNPQLIEFQSMVERTTVWSAGHRSFVAPPRDQLTPTELYVYYVQQLSRWGISVDDYFAWEDPTYDEMLTDMTLRKLIWESVEEYYFNKIQERQFRLSWEGGENAEDC